MQRQFKADRPNQLWVADLTSVKTHRGWVYVAFIIDVYSRMVVGWQASQSLRSDLAIDALEMAVWTRRGERLDGLVHHSDVYRKLTVGTQLRGFVEHRLHKRLRGPGEHRRIVEIVHGGAGWWAPFVHRRSVYPAEQGKALGPRPPHLIPILPSFPLASTSEILFARAFRPRAM